MLSGLSGGSKKGQGYTIEEVINEVPKDDAFSADSGGEITIGGGEPLAQIKFAAAILQGLAHSC